MAKKPTPARKSAPARTAASKTRSARPAASTEVRNSAIPPKLATARPVELTHEMIAQRAYDIYCSGQGGTDVENWCRAERELRAELDL